VSSIYICPQDNCFLLSTTLSYLSSRPEGRDPQCAIRMSHIYRSAPLSPLSTRGNRTHRTLISEHEELALSLSATLSYLSSRPERTRISCHAALDRAAYAPFVTERRMEFANATNFYRKSGVAEGRDLQCAIRMPHLFRSAPPFPLSSRGSRSHRALLSEHKELATSKNPRQQLRSGFSSICTSSAHQLAPRYQPSGLN
jgi:hypothetical protein